MKSLLLTLILGAFSFSASAQMPVDSTMQHLTNTLQQSGQRINNGAGLILGGITTSIIGTGLVLWANSIEAPKQGQKDDGTRDFLSICGYSLSGIGTIMSLVGIGEIGHGGRILMKFTASGVAIPIGR